MFKRTRISTAASLVVGSLAFIATAASAQQSLERVEITGSSIKRIASETPVPVDTYTRKDIERSGAATLNDFIKNVSSLDFLDDTELQSNSPEASGTKVLSARNLPAENLLVLLNGHRLPKSPMSDSGVDINLIPLVAIERIEVLKDGGSAIYGADAVSGVVNIITKREFSGVEVHAEYGTSSRSDGTYKDVSLATGFGDLAKDKYNLLLAFNYYKRDPILRKDRDISKSVDFRRFGGPDRRSTFAPQGNYLDANFDFTGAQVRSCPPELLTDSICRYDFNASLLTAYNGADRLSGMLFGTFNLGESTKANVEVIGSINKNHFEAHPVPDFFVDSNQNFFAGRFIQGGPRITDRRAESLVYAWNLDHSFSKYNVKVGFSHGSTRAVNRDRNYFDRTKWDAATTAGTFDPTATNNPESVVNELKVTPIRDAMYTIDTLSGVLSGDIAELSGGPLAFAFGVSGGSEALKDTPDLLTQQGLVVGSIQQPTLDSARNARAVFGELSIPIVQAVEMQLATRYDKIGKESKASPKVAVKFQPIAALGARFSYAKSFRAPTLSDLGASVSEGAITITEDADCIALGRPVGCQIAAKRIEGANPNLKPETGTTTNFGVLFEPTANFNMSVDFWQIKKKNEINTPTVSQAISKGLIGRSPINGEIQVFTNLQNLSEREVRGIDLDVRGRLGMGGAGNLVLRDGVTLYKTVKRRNADTDPMESFLDTYITPKYTNVASVTHEFGSLSNAFTIRTTAGFYDTEQSIEKKPASTRRVASFTEVDYVGRYNMAGGLEFNWSIQNLFDKEPPFSVSNASNNNNSQMGFAELYTNRGRFYSVGLKYKF